MLVREAETMRQRLLHVAGVKKVNIIGEQAERIYVEFSHERLATLGLSPQDVFAALNSQNALTAAGSVKPKARRYSFGLTARSTSCRRSAIRR